ncbi:MAG: hypothetical protein Q9195_009269 [Heterodermia aff. obscurata]
MDPVTLTTAVITLAGAVCKSYEQISKLVTRIRNASKELERIRSRAGSVNSLVLNLKLALEESAIRKVIERDKLALSHVEALDVPLKAVECTLDEVVEKIRKYYRPSKGGKQYKVRWKYYLSTSDWEDLQDRLDSSIQILGASMQGLNTFHVLRILGAPTKDPASTLRTYAKSILEAPEVQGHTSIGQRTPSPLPDSLGGSPVPLPLDERRLLAKKKLLLQRELLQSARNGDYYDVSILLEQGVETDWTDENEGMTALLFAARYGHLRVAERLIEAGADIEARSEAFGDDWIIRSENHRTPLIWAAAGRDCPRTQERMCRILLDKGADVNARNYSARTALQEAAMSVRFQNPDTRATMELLLQRGAYVNAYDICGWTSLTECGLSGKKELAELLLANGAHVDGKPGQDDPSMKSNPDLNGRPCETPLVVCAELSWNEELICLLLDKGADIEGKNKDGKTMQELASDAKRGIVLDELDRVRQLRQNEGKA